MGYSPTSEQKEIIQKVQNLEKNQILLISAKAGTGKQQPLTADIYTPTGIKKMKDIKIGDTICHPFKGTSKVVEIHPQGLNEIIEVYFSDGSVVECGEGHLWTVKASWDKNYKTLPIETLVERTLHKKGKEYDYRVPLPIVEYKEKDLYIKPYLMGVLIANGDLLHDIRFSYHIDDEEEFISYIKPLLDSGINITNIRQTSDKDKQISLSTKNNNSNHYFEYIKQIKLNVKSKNRFIPENYLYSSIEQRKELLAGLLDCNGSISKKRNKITYSSTSLHLLKQVQILVKSLGGTANTINYVRNKPNSNPYYRLTIKFDTYNPFKLNRKRNRWKPVKQNKCTKAITAIKYTGKFVEQQCITIDNPDGLYITNGMTVTHNSHTGKILVETIKPSSVLGFAFNKAIVEENRRLYPDYVEWKTLHALALSKVRPRLSIEDFTYTCIKESISYQEKRIVIDAMDEFFLSASTDMYEFMKTKVEDKKLREITVKYINLMIEEKINPTFSMILKWFHVLIHEKEIAVNYDMILLDECIPANYYVKTNTGYRLIQSIVNDLQKGKEILVKSFNQSNNVYEYKKAKNPLISNNRQTLLIQTEGLNELECTPNHRILTTRGYVRADQLEAGKDILLLDSTDKQKTKLVKSVIPNKNTVTVYDFEVEDNHNFIVSKSGKGTGIIVHNCQDSTAVALEIFKLIDANMKVGLGDEHQSLYAFMNLVNGFEILTEATHAKLTQSFRCSTEIAERVEKFGKQWLSHDFHFKGNPDPEADSRMMYVTATNAQIVERLAELQRQGINAYTLTRPITEIFAAPLALTTASKGKNVLHKKYKFLEQEYKMFRKSSYNKFFTFLLEEVDDEEIKNAIKLLMNFQQKRINIFDVMAKAKKARKDRNLIIGTVHSLKGLGVETVYVEDDLNRMILEVIAKGGPENQDDKVIMMMGYVAATRARKTILNSKYL